MANWTLPTLTELYANVLTQIKDRLNDLAFMLDPALTTMTNLPTDARGYSAANKRFEKWNGTTWVALESSYAINVESFGGQAAAYYTNIPGRLGYTPVNRAGDTMTGSLATTYLSVLPLSAVNGGQVRLDKATGDTVISGFGVSLDTSANGLFRIFESGGSNRGVYLDLAGCAAGIANQLWHSGNLVPSNYVPKSGATMTGLLTTRNSVGVIGQASGFTQSVDCQAFGANAAFVSFHRVGDYAVLFGLDTDNVLKVGGYSLGNNAYTIWHAGNLNPANLTWQGSSKTVSTAAPSGGVDGDIWFEREA